MTAAAKLDGPALREVTVRDYKRNAERAGLPVDMAAIERLAQADCETHAAVQREAAPTWTAPPDPEMEAHRAEDLQRIMAEETGAELVDEDTKVVREELPLLQAVPRPQTRWSNAVARCARITAGMAPRSGKRTRRDFDSCAIPDLAWELWRIQCLAVLRRVPPVLLGEVNPFFGLSSFDFQRRLQRMVEDICDRSTGHPGFGSWRTPK